MGMTLSEKILAEHAGRPSVSPGELIMAKVDLALGNDVTSPIAIKAFRAAGAKEVFRKDRIALVADHFTPNKDISSAEQVRVMREFAREQGIEHYYDVGRMGIEHVLLPDEGLVGPGDLVIGADSHTCTYGALCAFSTGVGSTDLAAAMISGEVWLKVPETLRIVLTGRPGKWVEGKDVILHIIGKIGVDGALYRSMEYAGDGIAHLPMAWRFTMTNMAIEAGAKNGIFPFDDVTRAYADAHAKRGYKVVTADPDARYADEIRVDLSSLEPVVAFPHLPENTRPVSQVGERADRPGRGGVLHQRADRGPPQRGGGDPGAQGPRRRADADLPGDPGDLAAGGPGRADGGVRRGGRGRVHPHLRPLPRRPHGDPGEGGAGDRDDEPELRRADGAPRERGLPLEPGGGGGVRRPRPDRRAGRARKEG